MSDPAVQQAVQDAGSAPGFPSIEGMEAWSQLAHLVLEATVEHAVRLQPSAHAEFSARIREIREGLPADASPMHVLISAGMLTQAIEHACSRTQAQLQEITAMLSAALSALERTHSGQPSAPYLAELRKEVAGSAIADWARARQNLEGLLDALRTESARTSSERGVIMDGLRDRITLLEQSSTLGPQHTSRAVASPAVDTCTGLPLHGEGEGAIQRALQQPEHQYLALFYLHRLHLTNARFGDAIGNQVILFASQHLAGELTSGEDQLFRWRGPAFVALLRREHNLQHVTAEVHRVAATPLSRFFETSSRTVFLPIKMTAEIWPLETHTYAEIAAHMEKFFLRSAQTLD